MARRKYEFRPDRSETSLLSKLYLTQKQRLSILKWSLYAVLLLVLSLLQDVILCRFLVFGATTDLIPCAIVLICVIQGAESSCVFSLIAACMYQFSGTAPGYYVIALLPALGIAAALFWQTYLRKSFGTVMVCAGFSMMLYELILYGIGLATALILPGKILIFIFAGVLSALVMPLLYPLIKLIEKIGGETWKE
jgi:hypothetical protein